MPFLTLGASKTPPGSAMRSSLGSIPVSLFAAGKLLPMPESVLHLSPGVSCGHQFLTSMSRLSSDLSNSLQASFNSLCSEGLEESPKYISITPACYAYMHTAFQTIIHENIYREHLETAFLRVLMGERYPKENDSVALELELTWRSFHPLLHFIAQRMKLHKVT